MRRTKGPVKVIKDGFAIVKIYRTPTRGCDSYTLSYYVGHERKRETQPTLELATARAKSVAQNLVSGEAEVLELRNHDRTAYVHAKELVAPFGLALDLAVMEYAEAKKIIGGGSLIDAAKLYAKRNLQKLPSKTVTEVVDELIRGKEAEGMSEVHTKDLRSRLGRFAKDFQCQLSSVTAGQIKEWLRALKLSGRSQNNYRMALTGLFNYAKDCGYLHKDHDEMDGVRKTKEGVTEIEIFRPEEMAALLTNAKPKLIPFLAISAFAGLRHAEVTRLDWRDVRFNTGHIHVVASKAKTGSRRIVPITDNLKKWLEPHRQENGAVCGYGNVTNQLVKLAKGAEVEWKHNALRHSFISYRVADTQNVAQVALEAGNSPQMIFQHYRELVTPAEAKEWFAIMPK
jgi:integrase